MANNNFQTMLAQLMANFDEIDKSGFGDFFTQMHAQNAQANQQASDAKDQYNQLAGAPVAETPGLAQMLVQGLGSAAGLMNRRESPRQLATKLVQDENQRLMLQQKQDLDASYESYKRLSDRAEKMGDLETELKAKDKQENILSKKKALLDMFQIQLQNQGKLEVARNRPHTQGEMALSDLTPEGKTLAAWDYITSGRLPRGQQLQAAIMSEAAKLGGPGLSLPLVRGNREALTRSMTSLQKMATAASAYEETALANIDELNKHLAEIPDVGSPLFNKPLRQVTLSMLGDKEVAAFNAAQKIVTPEFARLLQNPTLSGQLTNEAQEHVNKVLDGSYTVDDLLAVEDVLKVDAHNRRTAYDRQIKDIQDRLQNLGKENTPGMTTPGGNTFSIH